MAKKKPMGRPKVASKKEPIIGIKGVPEYKAWLMEFSEFMGLSLAATVDRSLKAMAEAEGFRTPPKR